MKDGMSEARETTSAGYGRQVLKEALKSGRWGPGDKLPTERDMVDMFGLKRMSLRQALLSLEHEGEIFRVDRKGWFVAQKRFIYNPLTYVSFMRAAEGQGEASWFDEAKEPLRADADLANQFGEAEGAKLLGVRGWGVFNGHRIFAHDMLINCEIAPDFVERLADRSFTRVWIEDYGITPHLQDVMIRPTRLEGSPQHMLGCTSGAPGLYIRRIKTDGKGRIIQIDREFWRFEAIELQFSPKDGD